MKPVCQDCHTPIMAHEQYHPYLFCILHKAGYDRERIIREIRSAAASVTPASEWAKVGRSRDWGE